MPTIDVSMLATDCVPHLHRSVITPRSDTCAIGRPRYCSDKSQWCIKMPTISVDLLTIDRVPHLHLRTPTARRNNALAIGRPRYRCYQISSMSTVGEDRLASGGLPDVHDSIFTCRGDATPIRRPRHRADC